MKKIFYLGSMAAMALPLVSVIACAEEGPKDDGFVSVDITKDEGKTIADHLVDANSYEDVNTLAFKSITDLKVKVTKTSDSYVIEFKVEGKYDDENTTSLVTKWTTKEAALENGSYDFGSIVYSYKEQANITISNEEIDKEQFDADKKIVFDFVLQLTKEIHEQKIGDDFYTGFQAWLDKFMDGTSEPSDGGDGSQTDGEGDQTDGEGDQTDGEGDQTDGEGSSEDEDQTSGQE